jgi:hypothetical protein
LFPVFGLHPDSRQRFYVVSACETVIRRSIPSPDGNKSIVLFGRECWATVGFNTQVSIAPTGSSFSADTYPAFFLVSGLQVVMARWLQEKAIEISIIPGAQKSVQTRKGRRRHQDRISLNPEDQRIALRRHAVRE